jgi:hypothetical protein
MMKDVKMDIGGQVEEIWGHRGRLLFLFFCFYFYSFLCSDCVCSCLLLFRLVISPTTLPTGEYPDESDSIQPLTTSLSPPPSTTTTAISQTPALAPTTSLLRLTSSINSTLFSNELEYLYIGKGFGEAFEFLFDSSASSSRDRHLRGVDDDDDDDADPESLRIDKLRRDSVFRWRSRLYSTFDWQFLLFMSTR